MVLMRDRQGRNLLPEAKKIREQFDLLLARVDKRSTPIVALSRPRIQLESSGTMVVGLSLVLAELFAYIHQFYQRRPAFSLPAWPC